MRQLATPACFLLSASIYSSIALNVSGRTISESDSTISFSVRTWDGLSLTARVIKKPGAQKKMILFINGSTPCIAGMTDPQSWFNLGIKLVADTLNEEAFISFSRATDPTFVLCSAAYTWMGHLSDLGNQRDRAITFYHRALDQYPGFPMQHDQWNMIIDRTWIEKRLKDPFTGFVKSAKK